MLRAHRNARDSCAATHGKPGSTGPVGNAKPRSRSATRPGDSVELRVLAPLVRGRKGIASRRHRSGPQDSLQRVAHRRDARSRRQSGAADPGPLRGARHRAGGREGAADRGERRHPRRCSTARAELAVAKCRSRTPTVSPSATRCASMGAPATRRWTPAFFIQQPPRGVSPAARRGLPGASRAGAAGHRRQSISCRGRHRAVEPRQAGPQAAGRGGAQRATSQAACRSTSPSSISRRRRRSAYSTALPL